MLITSTSDNQMTSYLVYVNFSFCRSTVHKSARLLGKYLWSFFCAYSNTAFQIRGSPQQYETWHSAVATLTRFTPSSHLFTFGISECPKIQKHPASPKIIGDPKTVVKVRFRPSPLQKSVRAVGNFERVICNICWREGERRTISHTDGRLAGMATHNLKLMHNTNTYIHWQENDRSRFKVTLTNGVQNERKTPHEMPWFWLQLLNSSHGFLLIVFVY